MTETEVARALVALERYVSLNAMDELVTDDRTGAIIGMKKSQHLLDLLENAQAAILGEVAST